MTVVVATYRPEQFAGVEALWQMVFPDDPPWNAAASAIPAKLAVQPDLFLVAIEGAQDRSGGRPMGLTPSTPSLVVGTIMAGYDGHRGWLYALAVHPDQRRRGIAKQLVDEAIGRLRLLGCRKVNLQARSGNDAAVAFWRSTGFFIEERVSMGRRI